MKNCFWLVLLMSGSLFAQQYPNRWVYVSRTLEDDSQVEDIRAIVRTASEHGFNGMVLTGLDEVVRESPDYLRRLEEVKKIAAQYSIEIIPIIFSAGRGSGHNGGDVLSHDRNLAEGLPVRDALFVVHNGEAWLEPDPEPTIVNGGFEQHEGDRATGYQLQERPGEVSFVDTEISHQGSASLRFDLAGGRAGVMQQVAVKPYREYRVTIWVKTENLVPGSVLNLSVRPADKRDLAPWELPLPSTSDWSKLTIGFNSMSYSQVGIYARLGHAKAGKLWLDDLHIEEVGLVNVLRRAGTPVKVQDERSGAVYEEGRDFAPITDLQLTFRFDHNGPGIRLLPESRMREGERLRVSYYHGMTIHREQVPVCMSEPGVYEIWRKQVQAIHANLHPRQYLLSMDEIRAGGSCQTCKHRGLTMAQILGDCLTRQFTMIREANPSAEVFTWSDMIDPNHNAHGNYYLVDGDFTGSWNYIPKDLRIVCWWYEKRRESMRFFSGLGFKTLAGAYYDVDTLESTKGWLDTLRDTPGAIGIMYTTWQNKYSLLAGFGDLIGK